MPDAARTLAASFSATPSRSPSSSSVLPLAAGVDASKNVPHGFLLSGVAAAVSAGAVAAADGVVVVPPDGVPPLLLPPHATASRQVMAVTPASASRCEVLI